MHQNLRVLIIDDDEIFRKIGHDLLLREGFDVSLSDNGEDGLKKVLAEKPDLIVLDLIMPGEHGLIVLDKLKKDEATKTIPIIVLSNFSSAEELVKSYGTRFVLKSDIEGKIFLDTVKEILKVE